MHQTAQISVEKKSHAQKSITYLCKYLYALKQLSLSSKHVMKDVMQVNQYTFLKMKLIWFAHFLELL